MLNYKKKKFDIAVQPEQNITVEIINNIKQENLNNSNNDLNDSNKRLSPKPLTAEQLAKVEFFMTPEEKKKHRQIIKEAQEIKRKQDTEINNVTKKNSPIFHSKITFITKTYSNNSK